MSYGLTDRNLPLTAYVEYSDGGGWSAYANDPTHNPLYGQMMSTSVNFVMDTSRGQPGRVHASKTMMRAPGIISSSLPSWQVEFRPMAKGNVILDKNLDPVSWGVYILRPRHALAEISFSSEHTSYASTGSWNGVLSYCATWAGQSTWTKIDIPPDPMDPFVVSCLPPPFC